MNPNDSLPDKLREGLDELTYIAAALKNSVYKGQELKTAWKVFNDTAEEMSKAINQLGGDRAGRTPAP